MDELQGNLAVETRGLRKAYGKTIALEDLTLNMGVGEVFGFLGPNGAGKTTTVKILMGLVTPTAGEAWILGKPLGDLSVKGRIGFLPEHFRFHPWLRAEELLHFHGQLYGMTLGERRRRVPQLLELVGLRERARDRLSTFSKGMLQRIGLAQALLPDPEIVFLDEPTSGLDPLGRRQVREILGDLRSKGVTVFLNSHILSEVELVCDRVAIIDKGLVVKTGYLRDLLMKEMEVELEVEDITPLLRAGLREHYPSAVVDGSKILVRLEDRAQVPHLVEMVVQAGGRLYSLNPKHLSLEELFVQAVEEDSPQ